LAQAEKQLLIRLVARADGQPVIAGFGRTLNELSASENKLQTEIRETNAEARRQSTAFGELTGSTRRWLGVLAGTAGLGYLAKQTFEYNQELEGTQIAIAGLLYANTKYTDSLGNVVDGNTAFQAANAESLLLLTDLQRESLKTAATVPQIADAFAIVYGALNQAGIRIENNAVVQLTTRLTQAASAMKVPMEQIRQEITSLLTGQVTQDSTIAKRIGLDNVAIKQMQANGTLVAEVMRRTEGYARAAEAQSNTVRGKLVNTIEIVTATLSRAFGPALEKSKGALDAIFTFFDTHGDSIARFVQRVVGGIDAVVTATGKWLSKHRDLVEEVLAIGAVVAAAVAAYGVLGVAIAALTSPITLTIAGIVAMALVWEKARKYSEIEVGGRPIAAYVRATMQVVATSWIGSIVLQVNAVKALWFLVKAVFGGLADLMLSPIHYVVGQISNVVRNIPASVGALIPGFDALRLTVGSIEKSLSNAFTPLDNAKKALDTVRDTASLVSELARVGGEKAVDALATKGALGGAADLVKDVWNGAAEWLEGKLPELSELGKKAATALGLTATTNAPASTSDPNAAAKASRAAEKLQREKDEYLRFINDYRAQANAAGDPLSQALAKISVDRSEALSKLEAQKRKLKDAISADIFDADRDAINKFYDAKAAEARRKAVEGVRKDILASLRLEKELTVGAQRETEDRRIALIRNSIQRELAERLAANARWFEDESERIKASVESETARANQIKLLSEERQRRDRRDNDDADRAMREQTFGYAEYWSKLSDSIAAQWRKIGEIISDTIQKSRTQLADAVNGFLDDLTSGQADLLKSLTGLSKGLTSLWTKALTEILMSGKNLSKQLQDLFRSIHVKNEDGSTDYAGTALQGAGFGGMVGGLFQEPGNYAGVGGSIGGAIGAVIGTYFGATGIGAAIGSAIGTAIGSLIQKGKDEIKVSIRDGVATVTEKGISAEARLEVQTQVQRKVKEEVKGWQALLDLFPEAVKDHLKALYDSQKLAKPTINLNGGVESADLTDEGALNALTDFLGNDLPKAAFNAYSGSITIALGQLGVGMARINELFVYWGTLQGKELHDAVQRYVVVLLDAADIRAKLSAPIQDKLKAAREYGQTRPLQQLDEIGAAIDAAVTRMAGLKDIEDIVAAQEEVNRLSHQYYEAQLQYLARIQQIQQAITTSIAAQREQIQLAGKDDQGKVDFFFRRMLDLREQLESSNDPEQINRLTQQIQQYVSQALGMAPENPEMHRKLLAILTDVENLAGAGLERATKEVEDRDAKPASALERAADLLMKAAEDLSGTTKPTTPPVEKPGGGRERIPRNRDDKPPREIGNDNLGTPVMVELIGRLEEMTANRPAERGVIFESRAEDVVAAIRAAQIEQKESALKAEDLSKAMRDGLRGMEFTALDEIVIDNGDLGESVAAVVERRVIARIKDDPYAILPRAA
jgi:uncharacterized membrane protein